MQRRDLLSLISTGAVGGEPGPGLHAPGPPFQKPPERPRGLPPLKITDIETILTAPDKIRLVVVKVLTSEPGLYGLGCATFTQRAYVVQTAVEKYLKPFLIGRNADEIEDIWQSSYVSSYWRNGPVLFNAMSGVDQALWDIKAKRAGMPLYQLLGGKVRKAADCYYHASGRDFAEVEERGREAMAKGFRHVRIQVAVPDQATYGTAGGPRAAEGQADGPTSPTRVWESAPYVRLLPKLFEHMRLKLGEEVELLHDVHERVTLQEARPGLQGAREVSPLLHRRPLSARSRTTTSGSCGSRRACPSRWESCSTPSTSTCPSSRAASSTSSAPTSPRSAA